MKSTSYAKKFGMLFVLIALCGTFAISNSNFLGVDNFLNIGRQVSMLAITAVGMAMIVIVQGIDLSIGGQIALIDVTIALLITKYNVNPLVACLIGVCLGALIGLINGIAVAKIKINPMIATLAMAGILRGLAYIVSKGYPIYNMPDSLKAIGQGYVWIIPIPLIIMVVVLIVGSFILNKTYFGRFMYAAGSNSESARLSGINIDGIKIRTFIISSLLTALAAIIMLGRVNSGQPNAATGFEMDVLTAVVLGGVSFVGGEGKISGVIIGVLIIGVLSNGLVLVGAGEYVQMVLKGAVLFGAMAFDSYQQNRKKKYTIPVN